MDLFFLEVLGSSMRELVGKMSLSSLAVRLLSNPVMYSFRGSISSEKIKSKILVKII